MPDRMLRPAATARVGRRATGRPECSRLRLPARKVLQSDNQAVAGHGGNDVVDRRDSEAFCAGPVTDATGRGSKLPAWPEAAGARRPFEDVEASTFIYYTRFFRAATRRWHWRQLRCCA
jgi:hypothetical protein